jgi:hypothetical protein
VFVNGVAGQNLAASTLYYVYVFSNAGVITADFSTTGRVVSSTAGNVGTQIKSGDNTRSLIGLIRTNAASQFVDTFSQRFVRTWFNDPGVGAYNASTGSTTSVTLVEITSVGRAEFLAWSAEHALMVGASQCYSFDAPSNAAYVQIFLDGAGISQAAATSISFSGQSICNAVAVTPTTALTEGYHWVNIGGATAIGTMNYQGFNTTVILNGSGA